MKYKSFLNQKIIEYIDFRKSYGFKGIVERDNLARFDQYLISKDVRSLSSLEGDFFLKMISFELERQLLPKTINQRITVLNGFFKYLVRIGSIKDNPLNSIAKLKQLYYRPYVFTPEEIKKILDYLSKRIMSGRYKNFFLARLSHYTALSVQAACGLRISEAINFKIKDFNPTDKTLYICQSKFRKDRLIPISSETSSTITNYLNTRRASLGSDDKNPYLFLTYKKDKGSRKTIPQYFLMVLREADMYSPSQIKGKTIFGSPSTHSFRHSFAVNTIRRWKSEGKNIDQIADTLATYMGHCDFFSTQVYLKALNHHPEILIYKSGERS